MRKGEKSAAERRKYSVGLDPRLELRRERAAKRQKDYDELTTEQRIARAEARPGRSKQELKRLRGE